MESIVQFLKDNPTYYLATLKDGKPDIRPFGTIALFEGRIYFQTGRKKDVYTQLKADPHIAICGWDGKGTWLRITATAIEDPRIQAEEAVLAEYPDLQNMYTAGDGNCVVFALEEGHARFCSFTQPEEDITF